MMTNELTVAYVTKRLKEGAAKAEIAGECGVSRQRVYQFLRERSLTEVRSELAPIPSAARIAYSSQRGKAKSRGIEWCLTLRSWWDFWQKSGHWPERGRSRGGYVMARFGDVGPYALGNIKICPNRENFLEARAHAQPRGGVHMVAPGLRNSWVARYRNRHLGYFATEQAARAARALHIENIRISE